MTSKNGGKYQVGFLPSFWIAVDWQVSPNEDWVDTTPEVKRKAAISRYALFQSGEPDTFTLRFTNTEDYNYWFLDHTGDRYNVNTFRKGDHYVKYSSTIPNIAYIYWS